MSSSRARRGGGLFEKLHWLTRSGAAGSRIAASELKREHDRFPLHSEELIMAERRKKPLSRKPAAHKSARRKSAKNPPRKTKSARGKPVAAKTTKRWSQRVTQHSDALDLKQGVFKLTDPRKIAASLKRSAEHSSRRKSGAYRSALSMLTFYINRAGKTLPKAQRDRLQRAKGELKRAFGRE